jgi:hypothetical protein
MRRLDDLPPEQQAWIAARVEQAPPLTPQQRAGLAALFDQAEDEGDAGEGGA